LDLSSPNLTLSWEPLGRETTFVIKGELFLSILPMTAALPSSRMALLVFCIDGPASVHGVVFPRKRARSRTERKTNAKNTNNDG
jgi:hypothetical protein